MRAAILFLLLAFCFAACRKEALDVVHQTAQKSVAPQDTITGRDTIPDKAGFKIKLYQDSSAYDDILFLFDHRSSRNYDPDDDAAYLPGMGDVSLASISGDGQDLAVYTLPYKYGMPVRLDFNTKTGGRFYIKLSYKNKIPSDIPIWLKDTYHKDSVNLCAAADTFEVSKTDARSFGNKRFVLVFGEKGK